MAKPEAHGKTRKAERNKYLVELYAYNFDCLFAG